GADKAGPGPIFRAGVERARREVDDTRRSRPVLHREAAGVDVYPIHRRWVEGTDQTLKVLEMKWIRQRNPIKLHQHIVEKGATDIGARREICGKPGRRP